MDTTEKWNGEAGHYQAAFSKGGNDYNRSLIDFLRDECGLAPGSRVIDIGCGVGKYGVYLARMGCEVTLNDISPKMLEYAAKNMGETGAAWHSLCGDWRDIRRNAPELGQKFDIAMSTMSPAVNDIETVAKMSAVTDGWCLLTRFYKWDSPLRNELCRRLQLPEKPMFSDLEGDCAEMTRCVSAAGFVPLVKYVPFDWCDRRSPQDAADRFISRYYDGQANGAEAGRVAAAALELADENGYVEDAVNTRVAWIYWNTKGQ